MIYRVLADLVLIVHAAFVVLVVLGWLLVAWRGVLAWVHVPIFAWGAWIELFGGICPLTPLEKHLRRLAGESGYEGGFIEHYLLAALYPEGLTRSTQLGLGVAVLVINGLAYAWLWRRHVDRRRGDRPDRHPS